MFLPRHPFNEHDALNEFAKWITPTLGEIKDTDRFAEEFCEIKQGIDLLKTLCDSFSQPSACSPLKISDRFFAAIDADQTETCALRLFSVLMVLTGKTDNNLKCQFPVFLNQECDGRYPCIKRGVLHYEQAPRTLEAKRIAKTLGSLTDHQLIQKDLLKKYLGLIVADESCQKQVFSMGLAYAAAEQAGYGDDFLTTLVIFAKRGSLTASQGHEPEAILRERMSEWGMRQEIDFNMQDISIEEVLGEDVPDNIKMRKYDFILPFRSRAHSALPQLFIQCQFYAGDSGSVSHKNVDQTTAAREATLGKKPSALFVDYIDGAGYYSSLNGDLRRLLGMPTTHDFFQVRTSPIRLRRSLQEIGFVTPLEIAQNELSALEDYWTKTQDVFDDIQWLIEKGFVEV